MGNDANASAVRLTLDQQRARYAWEQVQVALSSHLDGYETLAKSTPAMIMANGLMQTLAFLHQKSNKENNPAKLAHQKLCDHLCLHLHNTALAADKAQESSFEGTMRLLIEADSATYRRATEEALAVLRWIRQFASALS